MAELAQAQSVLKETLDKVGALEAQFDEANAKKVRDTNVFPATRSTASVSGTVGLTAVVNILRGVSAKESGCTGGHRFPFCLCLGCYSPRLSRSG